MNENINQLNENFETYQEILKDDMDYQNNNITSSNEQIKCYCGHTDYCDCGPLEEPKQECKGSFKDCFKPLDECVCDTIKQETLEDLIYQAIGLASNEQGILNQALATSNVMKILQERRYSEEEVKKIIINFLFEKGIGREVENVKEWFEQFKNK